MWPEDPQTTARSAYLSDMVSTNKLLMLDAAGVTSFEACSILQTFDDRTFSVDLCGGWSLAFADLLTYQGLAMPMASRIHWLCSSASMEGRATRRIDMHDPSRPPTGADREAACVPVDVDPSIAGGIGAGPAPGACVVKLGLSRTWSPCTAGRVGILPCPSPALRPTMQRFEQSRSLWAIHHPPGLQSGPHMSLIPYLRPMANASR